jgi:hypothetical protein
VARNEGVILLPEDTTNVDIEQRFRRYQDFGDACLLAIVITAIDLVLLYAFAHTAFQPAIRVVGLVCLLLPSAASIVFAFSPAPSLLFTPRSIRARLFATGITLVIVGGCSAAVALFLS